MTGPDDDRQPDETAYHGSNVEDAAAKPVFEPGSPEAIELAEQENRRRKRDAVIVAVLLGVVTFLHAFTETGPGTEALHQLYLVMYYVPILYAAFAFGLRGGLVAAAAATLLFVPAAQVNMDGLLGNDLRNLLEILMFFVLGGLFGWLRDGEVARTESLTRVSARLEEAYHVLEERAVKLMEVSDYTESILRSVTSGMVTVSPEGIVATANSAAERLLGCDEQDAAGRPFADLFEDDDGLVDDVRRVLAGDVPLTLRELTLVTSCGGVVEAQTTVSPMRDIEDHVLGVVVAVEDVTEVRAIAEQLIRADRLAAMGELTAGVAHEVRNPLAVIRASVQLLEDSECDEDRLLQATAVIKQEIDRLDRVIKALLDFGRPAAPTMRRVDINEVLDEVVLFTREFAGRGGVDIAEGLAERLPEVMGDPEQLKQVFVNLITNAVQAMEDQGGTLTVATGTEGVFVYARFTDTGRGVASEHLGKIFDPFFSTKDDGSGLGLTIVHRIVDEHDGRIEVASVQGKGTAFTVLLPMVSQEGR